MSITINMSSTTTTTTTKIEKERIKLIINNKNDQVQEESKLSEKVKNRLIKRAQSHHQLGELEDMTNQEKITDNKYKISCD